METRTNSTKKFFEDNAFKTEKQPNVFELKTKKVPTVERIPASWEMRTWTPMDTEQSFEPSTVRRISHLKCPLLNVQRLVRMEMMIPVTYLMCKNSTLELELKLTGYLRNLMCSLAKRISKLPLRT